jgi:hypothetical protein
MGEKVTGEFFAGVSIRGTVRIAWEVQPPACDTLAPAGTPEI